MLNMKAQFLNVMKHMYPEGVTNAYQHRDLMRVFAAGWTESLIAAGLTTLASSYLEELAPYVDPNWWPDESWQWW